MDRRYSALGFFFIACLCAELLPCCSCWRPFSDLYSAEQKRDRTAVRSGVIIGGRSLSRDMVEERAGEEVNQFVRGRGVYGGDSTFRRRAKRSGSTTMAAITTPASVVLLLHVMVAALVHAFPLLL